MYKSKFLSTDLSQEIVSAFYVDIVSVETLIFNVLKFVCFGYMYMYMAMNTATLLISSVIIIL